jgi:hypothetical protein
MPVQLQLLAALLAEPVLQAGCSAGGKDTRCMSHTIKGCAYFHCCS